MQMYNFFVEGISDLFNFIRENGDLGMDVIKSANSPNGYEVRIDFERASNGDLKDLVRYIEIHQGDVTPLNELLLFMNNFFLDIKSEYMVQLRRLENEKR